MRQSTEEWKKADPIRVAIGSKTGLAYAFDDARHDLLELAGRCNELSNALRRIVLLAEISAPHLMRSDEYQLARRLLIQMGVNL